uniref:Uncharacterized protein n=1 Tax=Rhizophora mucronata TaxID=61149 RepID=A0A2P2PF73_RHIMU
MFLTIREGNIVIFDSGN